MHGNMRNGMTWKPHALVEQLREALASVCGDRYFLIASKGPTRDVIAGLSDMDFRLVIDCDEPAAWRAIMHCVGDVFITFAHERREHWRLVEHLPATAYRPSELNHQPVCNERVGWEVLHESRLSRYVPPQHERDRTWYLRQLLGYQPPYNAKQDPPINVDPAQFDRFAPFSVCWHYYAPALRAAAGAMGTPVRTKRDALRWRAGACATSERAMAVLDSDFTHLPADLAEACAIRGLSDGRLPLPRVWYFPNDAPTLTLLDGDSDVYDWDCYEALAEPALAAGVPYTLNLMAEHLRQLDRARVDELQRRGQDFQLHYWPDTATPTDAQMDAAIGEQAALFEQTLGHRPVGGRAHTVVWPGYTDVAASLARHGLRIETNFVPYRGWQYGYLGSARPARFITCSGQFLPVVQQPMVFMDDPMSNEKSLVPARTPDEAYAIVRRVYEQSVERFRGVICTCLHPVPVATYTHYVAVQRAIRQAIIDVTREHGLPAMTTRNWSAFLEARRQLDLRHVNGQWRLHACADMTGCTVHLPGAPSDNTGGKWRRASYELRAGQTVMLT